MRLYDNAACSRVPRALGSAAIFTGGGLYIAVAAGSTTTVYATATDAVGNISGCSTSNATYSNVDDPGTPSDPGPGTSTATGSGGHPQPGPKPRACVVPKLAGKRLAGARKALKAAGCKLGKVTKPKWQKGKRRRVLVVKSASPRRGARPADRKVDLELRAKPKKARR